jgi:uncharacterized delta-60 repeat protein
MKRITIALALLLFASGLAYGQPEYLDKTFGDGGVVVISPVDSLEELHTIRLLPNGKILLLGYTIRDSKYSNIVLRCLHTDGSLDTSYGDKGVKLFPCYVPNGDRTYLDKLLVYPDSRVLLYGYVNPEVLAVYPMIVRLLPDGKVDSSFGVNGVFTRKGDSVSNDPLSLSLENDNTILALGWRGDTGYYNPTISRISSSGELLSSVEVNVHGQSHDIEEYFSILHAGIDSSGMCVFAATPNKDGSLYDIVLLKCTKQGVLDSAFGKNGRVSASITDHRIVFPSMNVLPDGRMLCLMSIVLNNGLEIVRLAKFTKEGQYDQSFGDDGAVTIEGPTTSYDATALSVSSDGRIAISGFIGESGTFFAASFHFCPDGTPDSICGQEVRFAPKNIKTFQSANDLIMQTDGKYLVLGWINNYHIGTRNPLVYRITIPQSGVSHSKSFTNSPSLHPTPSTDNCTVTYTLPSSGNYTMTLRDESGRQVRTFVTDQHRTAGEHKEELDLRGLASGAYFLQIESNGVIQTAKLIKQ